MLADVSLKARTQLEKRGGERERGGGKEGKNVWWGEHGTLQNGNTKRRGRSLGFVGSKKKGGGGGKNEK